MTKKEHAAACAARGWLVFPSEGKMPKVRWSVASTTDPDTIDRWWDTWPDADVCIKTGEASNLVVIDWDAYKLDMPVKQHPLADRMPATYTVVTERGGQHAYYTHPGYPVANSAGTLAPNVDVRGDGGMVVAYSTVLLDLPLVCIPGDLAQRRISPLSDPNVSLEPANPYRPGKVNAWAENIYRVAQAEIANAIEGKRNWILYAQASDVYRLVWGGRLDKDVVTQEMAELAYINGMEPHEIAATLQSAMRNAASGTGRRTALEYPRHGPERRQRVGCLH
jgi:putative DNA primase/helicase